MAPCLRWLIYLSRLGAEVVQYGSNGIIVSFPFELGFPCSINKDKYGALIIGSSLHCKWGFIDFGVPEDCRLIIQ